MYVVLKIILFVELWDTITFHWLLKKKIRKRKLLEKKSLTWLILPLFKVDKPRGVARNVMKMKPTNRISEISAEAQHFLQDFMCAQRSSKESLDVWLISAKQWLWSACAFAQTDLSHCLAGMWSCRKCYGLVHLISSEQVWGESNVKLPNLCYSPGFITSAWLQACKPILVTWINQGKWIHCKGMELCQKFSDSLLKKVYT